ncbi:hypothetical protein [Streptosporangium sp. NPDC023615]|uniref:hypothetical protein n=1 Tax=Streptosporangium sp. NPDC023615 TaxID=3154794 RepID=UPI00343B9E2F
MDVTRTTVPGTGTLVHLATREGQSLAVLVEREGVRRLLVYGQGDEPSQTVTLQPDEADQLAQVLHTRSVDDRLATLERRMAVITRTAQAAHARRAVRTAGVARGVP